MVEPGEFLAHGKVLRSAICIRRLSVFKGPGLAPRHSARDKVAITFQGNSFSED